MQLQFADFIEEKRTFVGQFEQAGLGRIGACKRAFFIAEQLALYQVFGKSGAVDVDPRAAAPVRGLVNRAGDEFLAGSRFAGDEYALGVGGDPIHHAQLLHQVYAAGDPSYTGRVTVPVLWDRKTAQIVNNESSEIIRMLNSAFDGVGALPGDFYPADLRHDIDALNARIYETVNNGVYRAGFARSQSAYDEAVTALFASLDWLEEMLSGRRWLLGERLTEADWRLFTTLVRFDTVYVGHFKCNIRRIADYRHLSRYLKELYRRPLIKETVNLFHIKHHYYESHRHLNPSGIVPAGPLLDL